MMQFFKFLDAYTLRARLFPAIIAAAPALAALALLISWDRIALSNVIATVALVVLLFTLADFARRRGVRVEPRIFERMGGKPSVTMLRHGDTTIDEGTKARYLAFLANQIGRSAPTAEEEVVDQGGADQFYEQCGILLRESTRDAKKFPILFSELVTYGFRRNLLGLKWPALALNLIVVAICAVFLWLKVFPDADRVGLVFIVAAIHALYVACVVTWRGVEQAARTYARQLILSCETLMKGAPSGPRRKRIPKPKAA